MNFIKISLCFFVGLLLNTVNGQSDECNYLHQTIYNELQRIEKFQRQSIDSGISMYDSLKPSSETLKQAITKWIEMGGFQTCPLAEHVNLKIVVSSDLNMVGVSWNTYNGGTMPDIASIIGYQAVDHTFKAKRMESFFQGTIENDKSRIDKIYTIKNKLKENIYLVAKSGQGSLATPYFGMTAYKLGAVMLEVPIFENSSNLEVDFDYTNHPKTVVPDNLTGIQFLQKGMYVRRPISEKNGTFNGRFEIYKFDGLKYRRIK